MPQLGEVYFRLTPLIANIINPTNPDPTQIRPDQTILGDLGFTPPALDNLTKSINDEFFTTTPMTEPEVQAATTVIALAEVILAKPPQK